MSWTLLLTLVVGMSGLTLLTVDDAHAQLVLPGDEEASDDKKRKSKKKKKKKASCTTERTYQKLVTEGKASLKYEDYATAIEKLEAAQNLCSEDPVVTFELARAQQGLGKCDVAEALYKQALMRLRSSKKTDLTPNQVEDAIAHNTDTCSAAEQCGEGTEWSQPERACVATTVTETASTTSTTPTPVPESMPQPSSDREPSQGMLIAGWTLVGAVAAAIVTGAVLVSTPELNTYTEKYSDACELEGFDTPSCPAEPNTTSYILLGAGGAAVATGVVLLVLDATSDDGEESSQITPWATADSAGVVWSARW